jgi:hypothetical protein
VARVVLSARAFADLEPALEALHGIRDGVLILERHPLIGAGLLLVPPDWQSTYDHRRQTAWSVLSAASPGVGGPHRGV